MPRSMKTLLNMTLLAIVGISMAVAGVRSETMVQTGTLGGESVITSHTAGAGTSTLTSVMGDTLNLNVLSDEGRYILHWLVPPALSCLSFTIERRLSETYSITSDTRWIEIGVEPGMCNLFESVPYSFLDRTTTVGMKGSIQYRLLVRTAGGGEIVSYSEIIVLTPPEQLEIRDVYPQPSSGDVNLSFLMPGTSQVTVRIFDMLGTEVRTRDLLSVRPGLQLLSLDLSSLPTGLYLCQIETQDAIDQRVLRIAR